MFNIFKINISKNISFKLYRYLYNLRSCFILSLIDLVLCVFLTCLNHFNVINFNNISYLVALGIFSMLWICVYIFFYKGLNFNSIKFAKILFFFYLYPIFFLHSIIGLTNLGNPISLGPYQVFILILCLFIVLNIWESVLLYFISCIAIVLLYIPNFNYPIIVNNLIFNIVLINLLAFIYSIIKFIATHNMYNTHELLISTLNSRDEANEKLKIHEKYVIDFFINISHDLKTPLNIIYSSQQLLEKQLLNNNLDYEKAEKYLTSIRLNSIRLTRLLNNVLDISKIDAAKFSVNLRNLDIVTTIEGITDSLLDFMNSQGINFIFDTDFEEMILALDEEKLERIILNLLSNALKFTPKGGTISIKLYEDTNFVFVAVKDTGIGMDETTQKIIFDRFVQGKLSSSNEINGSGIGLSLVKSLTTLHGGDVFLESKVGEGSTFTVKFPKNILEETLEEDIAKGKIYPSNNFSEAINIEFSTLIKK